MVEIFDDMIRLREMLLDDRLRAGPYVFKRKSEEDARINTYRYKDRHGVGSRFQNAKGEPVRQDDASDV